ncbi:MULTISPECIES: hypothetical protein [unclassified Marinomonas]|jgi:His-Xaa-Ser system protein HxsD|uniref:hypothetical protein n=1 Tax=unclassified Marinomonas TaxID=196814 RepID=UPI0002EBE150|nr:hypothetical protein [Marinomonas sp. ef1]
MTARLPMTIKTIELLKTQYSEYVIRNALYWLESPTELTENADFWYIHIPSDEFKISAALSQLLNDYRLREILSIRTGNADTLQNLVIEQLVKVQK